MYARHFGLTEAPFTLTPDTRFCYIHDSYQIALNTLLVAIRSGEGFTKVVGEVGTGKTLLCRMLLNALGRDYIVAYIPNPYLEPMTLLLAIADELGIGYDNTTNQHQLLKSLTRYLVKCYGQHRQTVVVCLDEAQAMPVETLEALRLLSNLETQQRKLIQLVLFGQPELDEKLSRRSIRQLRQRITFSYTLPALDVEGVENYLCHRLNIAGHRGSPLFSQRAARHIHRASGGIPRLVNILAHKSLMAAYGQGDRQIDGRHVRLAVRDTDMARGTGRGRRLLKYLSSLASLAAISAGALLWGNGL